MKRILIVDDVREIRRLIRLCSMHRFAVDEARDAPQALDLAQRNRPDLVVLDINLPGELDGLGLLARLRQDPALDGLRVVMVTASLPDTDAVSDVDAWFTKPFSPLDLADRIQALLN